MNNLFKKLSKLPFSPFLAMSLTLGLAPFAPPHVIEKLGMLFSGALVKPIDWFDLFLHGTPWLLLGLRIIAHFKFKNVN